MCVLVFVCVYVCGFVEVFSSSADLVCMWKRELCVYVCVCVCGFVEVSSLSTEMVCVCKRETERVCVYVCVGVRESVSFIY